MKYMLLIYGNQELWDSFPPEDFERVVRDTNALQAELRESGEFVGRLGRRRPGAWPRPSTSTTASPWSPTARTSRPRSTSGSFDIIDVESEERALEIAARVPFAAVGRVEVRPLMHEAAEDV